VKTKITATSISAFGARIKPIPLSVATSVSCVEESGSTGGVWGAGFGGFGTALGRWGTSSTLRRLTELSLDVIELGLPSLRRLQHVARLGPIDDRLKGLDAIRQFDLRRLGALHLSTEPSGVQQACRGLVDRVEKVAQCR